MNSKSLSKSPRADSHKLRYSMSRLPRLDGHCRPHIQARRSPPAGIEMVTHDPSGCGPDGFSPELAHEVATALNDYLQSYGADAGREATRVDQTAYAPEAHALAFPPEKMLIAIKQLFERAPLSGRHPHGQSAARVREVSAAASRRTSMQTSDDLTQATRLAPSLWNRRPERARRPDPTRPRFHPSRQDRQRDTLPRRARSRPLPLSRRQRSRHTERSPG